MTTPYFEKGIALPVIDIDLIGEPERSVLLPYWETHSQKPVAPLDHSLRLIYWREYQSWFVNIYSPVNNNCRSCR